MKKWIYVAGLTLALAVSSGVNAADKIAVVNIADVFQKLPQRETIVKSLEGEFKPRADELQKMEKSLQGKIQRLQEGGKSLKDAERKNLEKEVVDEKTKFSNKAKAFEDDNAKRQMEERNKLLTKIQEGVKKVADKAGYDFVIDVNAVAYASSSKDITNDVLTQLGAGK